MGKIEDCFYQVKGHQKNKETVMWRVASGFSGTRPIASHMAQRLPRDPPSSKPYGTAPHTRYARQQSTWHSGTHQHAQEQPPIAQRHARNTPNSNPHGTAPCARNEGPKSTDSTTDRTKTRRDDRTDAQQTKQTQVQPQDPQTINGNPSLHIREKKTEAEPAP